MEEDVGRAVERATVQALSRSVKSIVKDAICKIAQLNPSNPHMVGSLIRISWPDKECASSMAVCETAWIRRQAKEVEESLQ
jgi:hypothetical protein